LRKWAYAILFQTRHHILWWTIGRYISIGRSPGYFQHLLFVGSSPIKGPRCFLEQETLPKLLSTGWFQEWIRAWFHNRTKIK